MKRTQDVKIRGSESERRAGCVGGKELERRQRIGGSGESQLKRKREPKGYRTIVYHLRRKREKRTSREREREKEEDKEDEEDEDTFEEGLLREVEIDDDDTTLRCICLSGSVYPRILRILPPLNTH